MTEPEKVLAEALNIRAAAIKACEEHAKTEHLNFIPPCASAMRDAEWWANALAPDPGAAGEGEGTDYVAAKLMESAWGTRANLDMPEALTVARYLRSFGIAALRDTAPALDGPFDAVKRAERHNPPYPGIVVNDPDAGL